MYGGFFTPHCAASYGASAVITLLIQSGLEPAGVFFLLLVIFVILCAEKPASTVI